tara:strand:- start:572 stop:709 length:138 start_codon:yes stop_codon:yes gene_type:complete
MIGPFIGSKSKGKRLGKVKNKENHLPNGYLDLQRDLPYMRPYAGV